MCDSAHCHGGAHIAMALLHGRRHHQGSGKGPNAARAHKHSSSPDVRVVLIASRTTTKAIACRRAHIAKLVAELLPCNATHASCMMPVLRAAPGGQLAHV